MIFPLEELIKYDGNIYEITCAASRRAFQLATEAKALEPLPGAVDFEYERNEEEKHVSEGAREVFNGEVVYRLEA